MSSFGAVLMGMMPMRTVRGTWCMMLVVVVVMMLMVMMLRAVRMRRN